MIRSLSGVSLASRGVERVVAAGGTTSGLFPFPFLTIGCQDYVFGAGEGFSTLPHAPPPSP